MNDPAEARDQRDGALLALIGRWQERLMVWARNGLLARAARIALSLPEQHPGLDAVVARIAAAEFTDLPAILPLDWEEMEGSACAYAPGDEGEERFLECLRAGASCADTLCPFRDEEPRGVGASRWGDDRGGGSRRGCHLPRSARPAPSARAMSPRPLSAPIPITL